uniref:Uncharacterized protein n=1 Tax=Mus musculus TaxID=10090 RepID=Q3TNI6_MOUSE|nr:unnamed protein product [Mus musculus]
MTCSRPDPPPQLLLFGSVLECAPPDWAFSQEHRDPRVRMWLDLFPPYWTMRGHDAEQGHCDSMGTLVPSPVAHVELLWTTPCSQYAVNWRKAGGLWLENCEVCTLT